MEAERIFKRKIYDRLLQWKETSNGKSALLVQGARRIGKSTIVEEFARRHNTTVAELRKLNTDLKPDTTSFKKNEPVFVPGKGK